jgi:hypothetical protein
MDPGSDFGSAMIRVHVLYTIVVFHRGRSCVTVLGFVIGFGLGFVLVGRIWNNGSTDVRVSV